MTSEEKIREQIKEIRGCLRSICAFHIPVLREKGLSTFTISPIANGNEIEVYVANTTRCYHVNISGELFDENYTAWGDYMVPKLVSFVKGIVES